MKRKGRRKGAGYVSEAMPQLTTKHPECEEWSYRVPEDKRGVNTSTSRKWNPTPHENEPSIPTYAAQMTHTKRLHTKKHTNQMNIYITTSSCKAQLLFGESREWLCLRQGYYLAATQEGSYFWGHSSQSIRSLYICLQRVFTHWQGQSMFVYTLFSYILLRCGVYTASMFYLHKPFLGCLN